MKLKHGETEILRLLSHTPRTERSLSKTEDHAQLQLAPHIIRSYLDNLVALGLAEQPSRRDGSYHITCDGERYLSELPQVAPSRVICNASTSEVYRPAPWFVREGGEAHKAHKSRGIGT